MAKLATPPAPPWIRIVSPGLSFNVSSIALRAVRLVKATGARFPIGCVDAGREDIDHDFAGSRHRIGEIAVLQHFRSAVLIDESRFHLHTSIIGPQRRFYLI